MLEVKRFLPARVRLVGPVGYRVTAALVLLYGFGTIFLNIKEKNNHTFFFSLSVPATLTYDTLRFEYEDFPETKEPVWILGRKYSVFTGTGHACCNSL